MKKLTLLLMILILFVSPLTAKNQFGINLSYGYEHYTKLSVTECTVKYKFDLKYFYFIPFTGWQTWFYLNDEIKGHPVQEIYTIGAQIKIKDITIEYSHFCSHGVVDNYKTFTLPEFVPTGNCSMIKISYDKWF